MIHISSVNVYPSTATVAKGEWYYGAYASISSSCPECAEVRWYSNNSSIASVNATTGYIYGVNTGTTRIYAEATDGSGKKDYITVTVTPPVSVTGISVVPASKTMNVGDTDYLCETVYPSNATNKTVTWSSSDESVADVNTYSGFIRAKKAGTTTITATTADGGYSASCTVTVFIDTVIIQKDGAHTKVVFNNTGKVWRSIDKDMVFTTVTNGELHDRSNLNFHGHTVYNNNIITYTDNEIKLLYAIDPYGVADYVQRFANTKFHEEGLEGVVAHKDRMFRLLFGREPNYFARTANGEQWYVCNNYNEINDVISESETYFGMHPVYDFATFLEFLEIGSAILGMVFSTTFFAAAGLGTVVSKVLTIGSLILAGLESGVRSALTSYVAGNAFETAIEGTNLGWAWNLVSLYNSFDDLVDAMVPDISYNQQIINYCACQTGYNVLIELKNGTIHNLKEVH